jgi:hypothetical protein
VTKVVIVTAAVMCVLGCGVDADGTTAPAAEPVPVAADAEPGILEHPFTADQISEEWTEGLEITIRRWTPDAEVFELWKVVRDDDDGVDIESAVLDRDSARVGETATHRSGWVELRDHASFPADRATREWVTRETALGELEGWLYTVSDPETPRVSEFFFAESLPGAPVFVHVLVDGEVVEIFEQIERNRR